MRSARSLVPLLAALVLPLLSPAAARADLGDDVDRLVSVWSGKAGTTVERRPPRFIERGRVTVVHLDAAEQSLAQNLAPPMSRQRSFRVPQSLSSEHG